MESSSSLQDQDQPSGEQPARAGWRFPPLREWRTPLLSVSDVLTDVLALEAFLRRAEHDGETPVFALVSLGILSLSACMGSVLLLLVQRAKLVEAIYKRGAGLPAGVAASCLMPLVVPVTFVLLFILLCPVGHLLPLVLWVLSTWQPPPLAPSLAGIQARRAERYALADQSQLHGGPQEEPVGGGLGLYEEYAAAYREHLRDALSMGLQPGPPAAPRLEDFATQQLSWPSQKASALAELDELGGRSSSLDAAARGARERAEREWLEGSAGGFVHDRVLKAKQSLKDAQQDLSDDLRSSKAGIAAIKKAEQVVGQVFWVELVKVLSETEQRRLRRVDRPEVRAELLRVVHERAHEALRIFSLQDCRALADQCHAALDRCSDSILLCFRAERELGELQDVQRRLRSPLTRDIAYDEASRRAQHEPEVRAQQEQADRTSASLRKLERRYKSQDLIFQRQQERQRRMHNDFEHARDVTALVLDAEFTRAKFEHRITAEAGFIVETGLESVPQSLLQLTAIEVYTQRGTRVALRSYTSVLLSVMTVLSKVYVFCNSCITMVVVFKMSLVCMDTLLLFYTVQTLWECRAALQECVRLFFLTRSVDRPAALWICIHAAWGGIAAAVAGVLPLLLWGTYMLRVNRPEQAANPFRKAAVWMFRHARQAKVATFRSELLVIALGTLPFFTLAAVLLMLIGPPLFVVAIAAMRTSCLVLWLNRAEAALFQGANKAIYLSAYHFVLDSQRREDVVPRLVVCATVVTGLLEGSGQNGHTGDEFRRHASELQAVSGFRLLPSLAWAVHSALRAALADSVASLQRAAGRDSGDTTCLQSYPVWLPIWCGWLLTLTYSLAYVPFTAVRDLRFSLHDGQGPQREPLRWALLLAACVCCAVAMALLGSRPVLSFVRFAAVMPPPAAGQVVELPGGEAGARQRLLTAWEVWTDIHRPGEVDGADEADMYVAAANSPSRRGGYVGLMRPGS